MSRLPLGQALAGTQTFQGRFSGPLIPSFDIMLELPEVLDPKNDRLKRMHNRITKEALIEELRKHHKERIPDHFDFHKQKKYRYAKRAPETIAKKAARNKQRADLVRTGRTKREMKARIQIRGSGSASKGDVSARGVLRFKGGFDVRPGPRGVTLEQMKGEIKQFTTKEEGDVAVGFSLRYIKKLDKELKPRVRKRYGSKLRSLGI